MTAAAGPIAFAEKILALLELGAYSATYKFALLSAIMDLCLEQTSAKGVPPSTVTTRQLAEKVTELYWPHATPFDGGAVLRQGGVKAGNQAEILTAISSFRALHAGAPGELLYRAAQAHPDALDRLYRTVEWKLIEMPIPRLQVMGREKTGSCTSMAGPRMSGRARCRGTSAVSPAGSTTPCAFNPVQPST